MVAALVALGGLAVPFAASGAPPSVPDAGGTRPGPVDVRSLGARGDGVTDDTGSIRAAIRIAETGQRALYFPAGTYRTEKLSEFGSPGLLIFGDGPGRTTLKSLSGDHVIEITGQRIHSIEIRDLAIIGLGAGVGTGNGIFIHDNLFDPHMLRLSNLRILSMGGRGIFIPQGFGLEFSTVLVSDCGHNLIEVLADVSATFINVYVGRVAENRYGFHVYAGRPVFLGCNGIDGRSAEGASWAKFGRSKLEDGAESVSNPTLIGTNVEDFRRFGVRFVSGSFGNFIGCTFYAPRRRGVIYSQAVQAIRYEGVGRSEKGTFGLLDATSAVTSRGAPWANGHAIHADAGPAPLRSSLPGQGSVWLEASASTESVGANGAALTREAPATASSACEEGTTARDQDYLYVCVARNRWKRSALMAW
jgi:hypothetical protein